MDRCGRVQVTLCLNTFVVATVVICEAAATLELRSLCVRIYPQKNVHDSAHCLASLERIRITGITYKTIEETVTFSFRVFTAMGFHFRNNTCLMQGLTVHPAVKVYGTWASLQMRIFRAAGA